MSQSRILLKLHPLRLNFLIHLLEAKDQLIRQDRQEAVSRSQIFLQNSKVLNQREDQQESVTRIQIFLQNLQVLRHSMIVFLVIFLLQVKVPYHFLKRYQFISLNLASHQRELRVALYYFGLQFSPVCFHSTRYQTYPLHKA